MSTFSNLEFGNMIPAPVKSLEYRDMGSATNSGGTANPILEEMAAHDEAERHAEIALSQNDLSERILRERDKSRTE